MCVCGGGGGGQIILSVHSRGGVNLFIFSLKGGQAKIDRQPPPDT